MDKADILVVDDTPANLLAWEAILSKLDQNVVRANSGKEALKLLLKKDFAVIILDINMPGMNGFETASLIRQRKSSELTPIIFVTAYSSTDDHRDLSYSLGAVDYIYAPVVPEVLQSKVAVFVELYKKTAQIKRLHEDLKRHAGELEHRVEERTLELRKANEELIRLNKIKSEFTSMVSHELRTPLTAIKSGIEVVLDGIDGPINEEQKQSLSIVQSNVDRLDKLILNVLDFTKFESGKIDIFFDKTNLNKLATDVFILMNPVAHKKGVVASLDLPPEDLFGICDADKVRQLLINLFDNAIKFTEKSGRIFMRLSQHGDSVRLELEDTGIGIAKNDFGKIFEMFGQVHHKGDRKTGGTGIGLAVCRKIAQQHRGDIVVDSAPGLGTKFTFAFPKGEPDVPTLLNASSIPEAGRSAL